MQNKIRGVAMAFRLITAFTMVNVAKKKLFSPFVQNEDSFCESAKLKMLSNVENRGISTYEEIVAFNSAFKA